MEVSLTRVSYPDTVRARLIVNISKGSRRTVISPPATSLFGIDATPF